MIVSNDIEIWLLFAPFWILGIAALIGSAWHGFHAVRHARPGQAAGHAPDRVRHHKNRALIALAAFIALMLLGIGVGAAVGLILRS